MAGVAGANPVTAWGVEGHIEPALDDLDALLLLGVESEELSAGRTRP